MQRIHHFDESTVSLSNCSSSSSSIDVSNYQDPSNSMTTIQN